MTPTEKMIEAQRQRSAAYKEADDFYNHKTLTQLKFQILGSKLGLPRNSLPKESGCRSRRLRVGSPATATLP